MIEKILRSFFIIFLQILLILKKLYDYVLNTKEEWSQLERCIDIWCFLFSNYRKKKKARLSDKYKKKHYIS